MFNFFKPKKKTQSTELNKKLINSGKLNQKITAIIYTFTFFIQNRNRIINRF